MDVREALEILGGIASGAELRAVGCGQDRIDRATRTGAICRIHRGWFALASADPATIVAVAHGGTLSCVSVLRRHSVWLPPDARVHVRIDPHGHGCTDPTVRSHWLPAANSPIGGRDSVLTALEVALECLSFELAIAAIDSVREKRLLSMDAMTARFDRSPRARSLLRHSVGDSGSGIETLVRVRLGSLGVRVRTQVGIPGVGRVDLVVGDRLILEIDGREFHDGVDAFDRDRRRDLAAAGLGYLVIRLSYRQVVHDWLAVELQLLGLIRRREHLWRSRHPGHRG